MESRNGSSNISLTLCQVSFYHSQYYCADCNWQSHQWFSIIQLLLGATTLIVSCVSIIWSLYQVIHQHNISKPSIAALDGRRYWISCCFSGLLFCVGHVAESITLACGIGPSQWGDLISNCVMHLATETGVLIETVCSCKVVLGMILRTRKNQLFQSPYPSLRVILLIWGSTSIVVGSTTIVKYHYNSIYMKFVQPVQSLQLVLLATVVILLISIILYAAKVMSNSCKLGTNIFVSDEWKKRLRNNRLRLRFHLMVLGSVMLLYLFCTVYFFGAKSDKEIIDQSICMLWMVPYKLLTIIYAMGKSIVVVWELWYK